MSKFPIPTVYVPTRYLRIDIYSMEEGAVGTSAQAVFFFLLFFFFFFLFFFFFFFLGCLGCLGCFWLFLVGVWGVEIIRNAEFRLSRQIAL